MVAKHHPEIQRIPAHAFEQVVIEAQYDGYLQRQQAEATQLREEEKLEIPTDTNYDTIAGLSNEVREKLKTHTPNTIAAAGRISGVTPAALTALWIHLKKQAEV